MSHPQVSPAREETRTTTKARSRAETCTRACSFWREGNCCIARRDSEVPNKPRELCWQGGTTCERDKTNSKKYGKVVPVRMGCVFPQGLFCWVSRKTWRSVLGTSWRKRTCFWLC
ncbi:hypothetical protein MT325_m260R [Paramecium bursaria chlorella virus MT325]|uniref:Uncharacterized protein m260R n=1 Tax=Paramecium bursaria Chlorella virus MT325 TaxID=346932 RepID=A7ITZ0_PBCVM|nr:hypothetical protein MT325_m260R [Paramecium bursaria chlorella virus MT325]